MAPLEKANQTERHFGEGESETIKESFATREKKERAQFFKGPGALNPVSAFWGRADIGRTSVRLREMSDSDPKRAWAAGFCFGALSRCASAVW